MKAKSMLFWCCKPLGLQVLRYMLSRPDYGLSFTIGAVITSMQDKSAEEIRNFSVQNKIQVFENESEIDASFDLGFCIGYPKKISKNVLDLFNEGIINLHFAPLPSYRGSGTLSQAIINGDREYGVTLHLMDEGLDTGPIIGCYMLPLPPDKTALEIIKIIEPFAFQVIVDTFSQLICKQYSLQNQLKIIKRTGIHPQLCTRKFLESLYRLDFDWEFDKIHRYLRALSLGTSQRPFFELDGKKIFLSLLDE